MTCSESIVILKMYLSYISIFCFACGVLLRPLANEFYFHCDATCFFKDSEQNWTKSLEDKEILSLIQSGLPFFEAFFCNTF